MIEMETPYKKAWDEFASSPRFRDLLKNCRQGDEDLTYTQHRIRIIFDAGWNYKTSLILETLERTIRNQDVAVLKANDETKNRRL
jgi:hypothetical protein